MAREPNVTLQELADDVGCSVFTAWSDVRALGLRTANRSGGGRPPKGSEITDERIIACHSAGNPDAAIARHHGVSRQDITYRRYRLGLPANHHKGWPMKRGPVPFVEPNP